MRAIKKIKNFTREGYFEKTFAASIKFLATPVGDHGCRGNLTKRPIVRVPQHPRRLRRVRRLWCLRRHRPQSWSISVGKGRGPCLRYRSTARAMRSPFAGIRVLATYLGQGSTSWMRVFTSFALPALKVTLSDSLVIWLYDVNWVIDLPCLNDVRWRASAR